MPKKEFFYQDKSGRGITNNFNEKEMFELAEKSLTDEVSWDGDSLYEWLDNGADEGDVWENAANKITRIK